MSLIACCSCVVFRPITRVGLGWMLAGGWLFVAMLCPAEENGEAAKEPSRSNLGVTPLPVDMAELLLSVGKLAEKDGRWADALLAYRAYLSVAGTAPMADKVRQELKDIQWRVQVLKSPEALQELQQQKKDEAEVRQMLGFGLFKDAAAKSLQMVRQRPSHWRSYFLAAAAFEKLGDFNTARQVLRAGRSAMDATQAIRADTMIAAIDDSEKQSRAVARAQEHLKHTRYRDAAVIYRDLVHEHPNNLTYRRLALQISLLAEDFGDALKLVEDPSLPPEHAMPKEVHDKLVADILKLQKDRDPAEEKRRNMARAEGSSPARTSSADKKKSGSSSMADDFLTRIKKK